MKLFCLILFFFFSLSVSSQQTEVIKPSWVIIAADKIISEAELEELAKEGFIKTMNKGVSKLERDRFYKLFGDAIGDKEFIITISLFTEKERVQRKQNNVKNGSKNEVKSTAHGDEISINDVARNFAVEMMNGDTVELSDLKGNVVLINFWATWCGPCLMEFYEFQSKILDPFKHSSFKLLAISRGEKRKKVENKLKQLEEKGIVINAGLDSIQVISELYGAKNIIPKNVIIDKKGVIRYISKGYAEGSVDKLASVIRKLVEE